MTSAPADPALRAEPRPAWGQGCQGQGWAEAPVRVSESHGGPTRSAGAQGTVGDPHFTSFNIQKKQEDCPEFEPSLDHEREPSK